VNTIQIVLSDLDYARWLQALFLRDGHPVTIRDSPDLNLDGVIVVEADWLERIDLGPRPERFVAVASRSAPSNLTDLWSAGVRYMVYREDPIENAHLAILAADLRLPNGGL
jgi:hypothetical protein